MSGPATEAGQATADIAIVGAGLVGAALALGCARQGARVTLCDAGEDRFHASAGNFGLVWVQGKGQTVPAYARLSRRSAAAWAGFADSLADEHGTPAYAGTGGVKIALGQDELNGFAAALDRMRHRAEPTDNDTRLIDARELRERVPAVGPDAVGGLFCPHDGHADPLGTLHALHRALVRHPRVRVVRARIERVLPGGTDAPFTLQHAAGGVRAARVVIAAGHGAPTLAAALGLDARVRPQRGQIVVTERVAPFLDIACHTVRRTGDGTLLLGDSKEDVGFDVRTTGSATRSILARAVRTFPHLAGVRVVRTWGALRVLSPDGLPIYQASTRHPGASLVTCHSGVTLAASHATEVARALVDDRLAERYAAFSPARFALTGDERAAGTRAA